jgi:DNA-binding SARP family transcriptional activator
MEFGLLGPLLVSRGGVVVPVRRGNQRTVLARLLLAANRTVSVDAIAEALWGSVLPPSAPVTIRNYVRRLRQALGDDGRKRITAQPHGYMIHVAPGELDVSRFEDLIETARAWAQAGAWDETAARARAALALWRGEPLADVESAALALREVPRLAELRWQALETRIDADLRRGAHAEVVAELRHLVGTHPLREQVHGFLMLALHRCGRSGEALAAYQHARKVLAGELGAEPGARLQHLHQQILTAAPALILQEPALTTFQLPAAPADFTGRQGECEMVLDTLAQEDGVPVVAISGQPGVGKTALALYAAHQARNRFPDGQLWVQLSGTSARPRDPGEALGELLRACGLPGWAIPDSQPDRAAAFRSTIAGRRLLIVADDAASAGQVVPLLPGTPGCAIVVTSRMRLEGLAGARLMPLDVLPRGDAVDLLSRILGSGRVAADPVGVGELADACGELPLALRVAGARLATRPSWPVSAITHRLTTAHSRLRELETDSLSVRASIATSYDLLPERHQRAFRFLAILGPSDFAEWVVPALLGEPQATDVLDELLRRSLVTPTGVDATGEPRYRLHDLLREYAAERLAEQPAPVRQAATDRLLVAYLQLAQQANTHLPLELEPYFPPPVFTSRPAVLPAALA